MTASGHVTASRPVTASTGSGAVHVTWGRVGELGADARVPCGLATDEVARAERTSDPAARRQFVAGRVLLRSALGKATGVAPEALRFRYRKGGKPFLPGGPPFSLSHSGDSVIVAVGTGGPAGGRVGVDVEVVRPVRRMAAVVRRRFAPEESTWWAQAPPARRVAAFFQVWSRKEAVAKALGGGLAVPGAAFAVVTEEGLVGGEPAAGSAGPGDAPSAPAIPSATATGLGPLARLDLPGERALDWSVGELECGSGTPVVAAVAADWPAAVVVETSAADL